MYMKNTLTISGANITEVVFTFGSGDPGTNEISSNTGKFSTNTWTGSANSVMFTFGANASGGHRRVAKITVTIGA